MLDDDLNQSATTASIYSGNLIAARSNSNLSQLHHAGYYMQPIHAAGAYYARSDYAESRCFHIISIHKTKSVICYFYVKCLENKKIIYYLFCMSSLAMLSMVVVVCCLFLGFHLVCHNCILFVSRSLFSHCVCVFQS